MPPDGLKVDLHVHSKMSDRPSQWILQKISCPESFTSPFALYQTAKQRGMDLVTITDHNTINGILEIAHLPDTFISEEVTTYFPEDNCKIHVLALDITEAQHREITRLRKNVYELTDYFHKAGILHVLAHPLFDLNHKLSVSHFEKMLLLFSLFELNGARDGYQNRILASIVNSLGQKQIETLADKHGIEPAGVHPWIRSMTGGSDDHSGLNIARIYTMVDGAETKEQFLEGLKNGRSIIRGKPATPKTMAHNLYGIAYQYYKSAFRLQPHVHKDVLFRFIDRALTTAESSSQRGLLTRIQDFLISRRPGAAFLNDHNPDILSLIQKKGRSFLHQNTGLRKLLRNPAMAGTEKEEIWFEFVNGVSEQIMRNLADTSLNSISQARLFNIFQTMGSAGSVYFLLAPYFMTYRLFSRDRHFAGQCHLRTVGTMPTFCRREENVALFTDTFHETNGVALTLRMQLEAALKYQRNLTIITCSPEKPPQSGVVNFTPIGFYELPEYPGLKLYYPPFLKMLDYCFENQITHIHASTPGPVGWAAVAVARIMAIPVYGTYHTALPQYAGQLTGDEAMGEVMWKAMAWYYNQLDRVYVPSRATGEELAAHGVQKDRICYYSRGIDIDRFHPRHGNGFWSDKYGLNRHSFKLLYVGRVSREKDLDVLVRAFVYLEAAGLDMDLIIVGDGPYKAHMQAQLTGSRVLFTGELTGHDLQQAFASSDLFVFPSSTDTFGNVILEAQASGLPVIVTDCGGPRENLIDGKTGRIVPAMNPEAIAGAVQDLYEHPEVLGQMKKQARLYMKDRSFDRHFLETWQYEFAANADQTTPPGPDDQSLAQWPLAS